MLFHFFPFYIHILSPDGFFLIFFFSAYLFTHHEGTSTELKFIYGTKCFLNSTLAPSCIHELVFPNE